ncbi:MAG TPA: hypothetical protein VNQ77_01770 [Frankiaceae bacterium]|nr:hypothetical protein [Frankiaceae bacterium]
MKLRAAALAAALLLGAVALPARGHSGADRRPGATQFDLEVQISKPNQPAYDSRVVADRHGNLYAVARKVTPASPDDRLTTAGRTSSWRWTSADGGATWQALSGPAEADARLAGGVTDVAADDAGNVYVLDGQLVLRYASSGLGTVAFEGAGVVPATAPTALVARGDGVVLVLAKNAVHASYDGGQTFGATGYALAGAADCRIAAGPKKAVYASCLDGAGKVLLFGSRDDARTFAKKAIASYDPSMPLVDVPPVAVTKDGTVYVLRGETTDLTHLYLLRSADGGRTWTQRRATDEHRRLTHLSLTASPDGRLGAAMYLQDEEGERWFIGGGIFSPDANLLVVSFADHSPAAERGAPPPEGAPGATFLPDSRLALTWTVVTQQMPTGPEPLLQDVWFVRSQVPGTVDNTPKLSRTPRYDIPPCTVEGQVSAVKDWQQIGGPAFRARPGGAGQDLVSYAVDPYEPRILYATNGTTLMRSADGGCRWHEVWSLEAAPSDGMPAGTTARVVAVAVPEDRREHRTVFAVLDDAGRPRVVKSESGDAGTFALADSGLPPTGTPGLFRVAGANPDFLYLTVGTLLYASEDGGASWALRTSPAEVATGAPAITALALDPKGPNNLYAVRAGALVHSRDGGRTWTAPAPPAAMQAGAGEITAVDVFHADTEAPRVTAWSAPGGSKPATVLRSPDDGVTWTAEKGAGLQGSVEAAAHGSTADILVVSTRPANGGDAEVYRRDRRTKAYVALSPVDSTQPFRVSADRRGHPTFYGMGLRALFRYAGDDIEPPPAKDAIDDTVFDDIDPPAHAPVVTPRRRDVTLTVGTQATVPFTVELPPVKPRVDVMVLMDTSKSMQGALPGIRRDLLAAFRRLGKIVDLRVGIAQAKTNSRAPIYRRERDVGPLDAGFVAAFGRLKPVEADGGLETQLIGLDQIVTGEGMAGCESPTVAGRNEGCLVPPVGTFCEVQPDSPGCAVRPGQQASFRDGAVRVVLHSTDVTFRNPEGTPRGANGRPDVAGVAAKYAAAKVLQVGVAADPEGAIDLGNMARRTGAVAPAGGLDCTGDGVADVAPGRAAVCRTASHIDGVIAALVRARTPSTHVHAALSGDKPAVLDAVTPEEFHHVDHTVAQRLPVRVTVSCAGVAPGRYAVNLDVRAHDEPATSFGVDVVCDLPGATAERRPRPGVVVPPLLPPIPPPAVPANPPPNVNVNPNVQTQAQTQVQAQAGAAQQERDQAELALAENDMTDGDSVPAPVVMLAGMLGVSAAAAYSSQRRTQTAPAQVRSRR